MSELFGNLGTEGTEATEDRLGGNYDALPANIYTGKIKMAYAGKSAGGARNLTLILSDGDFKDREYRETVYVTNRKGENFYMKDDKKHQLPGFITINHLAQIVAGVELKDLAFEDKMVKIYDPEAKKEVPTSVPVATGLIGQEVSVAIKNTLESQTVKNGSGDYVPKDDGSTRNVNNIEKVFHTASKMTIHEAQAKQKDANVVAEFWDAWTERNKDKVVDKTTKTNGKAGAPGGGGAPTGGNSSGQTPRTSLFGGS